MNEMKSVWKTALENGKTIASTILVFASLIVGSWTLITSTFLTNAKAEVIIMKLDKETSYNKAFRLDTKITKLEMIQRKRKLTREEMRSLKRMRQQLEEVDLHIEALENSSIKINSEK
jgi:hypothetical protein